MPDLRRLVALASALAGLALLGGCSVMGDVWVDADNVRVDVEVRDPATLGSDPRECTDSVPAGLVGTPVQGDDGLYHCHVQGTLALGDDTETWATFLVAQSDGFVSAVLPSALFGGWPGAGEIDLFVYFPGEVLAASGGGTIDGTLVHWTDGVALAKEGFAVTARTSAWPAWLVPGAAGVAAGALAAAGAVALARSRPTRDEQSDGPPVTTGDAPGPEAGLRATAPGTSGNPPAPVEPELPPEDPEVWSRP